jgi:hypothetical protein
LDPKAKGKKAGDGDDDDEEQKHERNKETKHNNPRNDCEENKQNWRGKRLEERFRRKRGNSFEKGKKKTH